ncbi:hypothetical protein [Pseudomonas lopnurensis]|uniref:hypothetical protein n=1 Tax=Pseudomonas lopnurensis TaxID=1477517 RepID=UPI0028B0C434|nr:hypothetical protein [Pseudomonas lopnurensis]
MSHTKLTPAAARILSLPVVFTPEAWQQAISIDSTLAMADIEDRLSFTIAAAYQAALADPSQEQEVVDFGLHRLPPDGDPHAPLWLDLQASRQADSKQQQLLISLKQPLTQAA